MSVHAEFIDCSQPNCGYRNKLPSEFCAVCGAPLGTPQDAAAAAIPALPENATPEQKEAHWYKYVYQGDRMPQLTLRAVIMGGILGMFMSISNLYTTLQLGWAFGVAITACVLSYVIWNGMRALTGGALTPMSLLENNCMQSTASAAGYSTGSTMATCFGSLLLISGHHTPWEVLLPFTLLTAALGVFLAVPMKRQMINIEQLKFPSGIAAAETLRSLYSHGNEAIRKAYSLLAALAVGGVIGFLRSYGTLVEQLKEVKKLPGWFESMQKNFHIVEQYPLSTQQLTGVKGANLWNFGVEPSALLVAAGMITGMRVSLSMLFGSVMLYFFVAPWLISIDQQTAGSGWAMVEGQPVWTAANADPKHFNVPLVGGGTVLHIMRWSLWGGSALLVFASLTSVALQWKTIVRSFSALRGGGSAEAAELARIEVPTSWLVAGLIPITIAMVFLLYVAFNINVMLGLIAVALSFVISLVCCRATGETDTTPIGAMGKVTQLLYAVLPGAAGNASVNLLSAGLTANAGSSSADLLTDLKSGYLLGANPRKQFLAQFFGIFFGTLAVVPAWYLMVPNRERLEKFNLPATSVWKAVADALTKGLDTVPVTARYAILIGGLVGVLLPVIAHLKPKLAPYLPSAMGLGLAWVVGFHNALAFAMGALIVWIWQKISTKNAERYYIPIASGLVAGESLAAALIAICASLAGIIWAAN